jgi:plastocyanin
MAMAVLVAGCGEAGDDERPTPKVVVEMRDGSYAPAKVRVPVGGRVTWVNVTEEDAHTAQSPAVPEVLYDLRILDAQNRFDLHTLQPGEAQSAEFDTPGRYRYFSSFDNSMTGVVEVVPAR